MHYTIIIISSINIHAFTDVDECIVVSTEVCLGAEVCVNIDGSYMCLCATGHTWNGTFCNGECTYHMS